MNMTRPCAPIKYTEDSLMNDKLIIPHELYVKSQEALPPGWPNMLFDTYDTNPDKSQRVVRLDSAVICNPDNLTKLTNDIIESHCTRKFSITISILAIISTVLFIGYCIVNTLDPIVYLIYVLGMAMTGKYYITHLYLQIEKQKYASSVLIELCNVVLIENESNKFRQELNRLKATPQQYYHLLNYLKSNAPELYSEYTRPTV